MTARLFGSGDGWEESRHGGRGWLAMAMAALRLRVDDKRFLRVVLEGAFGVLKSRDEVPIVGEVKGGFRSLEGMRTSRSARPGCRRR